MIDYQQLATNLILMLSGGIGTAAVWSVRKMFKLNRDMDFAFMKIRELQKAVFKEADNSLCKTLQDEE